MKEVFISIYNFIINLIYSLGILGAFLGSLLIVMESILPFLPLFVFITINFQFFGFLSGFLISWLCTVLGCLLAYTLVKRFFKDKALKKIRNVKLLKKCLNYVQNLNLMQITVILAIPFTPAFMMNIAAGIAEIPLKKFLPALIISKMFIVYFWGFVGTSFIESFKNPRSLITIFIMLLGAYLLSLLAKKIFKID